MDGEDLYKVLGVDNCADDKEIRGKFRELAMRWHPDKNGTEEANQMFQRINQAYSVLSDPEKRRKYDLSRRDGQRYHRRTNKSGRVGSAPTFDALFERFYGRDRENVKTDFSESENSHERMEKSLPPGDGWRKVAGSPAAAPRIPNDLDILIDVHCTLEEMFDLSVKYLQISRQMEDGETDSKSVKVTLTPGLQPDTEIRLENQGNRQHGHIPGDLILTIRQESHERYIRVEDDIVEDVSITLREAISCDFEVNSVAIDGEPLSYLCDEVIQNGSTIRMKGRGMRHTDGTRGDHIFRFKVLIPLLTPEQRNRIIQILDE
jgi:DnaJ-class molecular chaperone